MMSSATTVKRVRMALDLSQHDFAEKLNLTPTAIFNYEKGIRTPKISVIKRMKELAKENGIELSVDDFLN